MPYQFDEILTLEARSNFMLEMFSNHYKMSESRVFAEIQSSVRQLRGLLKTKGIEYADLKSALVPDTRKIETAFYFDWTRFDTSMYGRQVIEMMLPHLERSSSRSFLLGDWSSKTSFAQVYRDTYGNAGPGSLIADSWQASTIAFFYVNNLTPAALARLEGVFANHPAYIGALDLTHTSLMKAFLSTMLVRAFIQHRSFIIQPHSDEGDASYNENTIGYDFQKFGYTNRSVDSWLYQWFLSYKIERPALDGETDTHYSLNALTPTPRSLAECEVRLDELKLQYLQQEKIGSVQRAGMEALTASEVARQVQAKLEGNYIYCLRRATDADCLLFNVIIEVGGTERLRCGLEYFPQEGRIQIVTLF